MLQVLDYPQLLDLLERAYPGHQRIYWEAHGPEAVTTVVVQADGVAVQCGWVYGQSGRWSLIVSRRPSPTF